MKKGFTLIELLAVIVILAIIALIATPIVLNIIEDTKKSAMIRSADFYLDGVEKAVATSVLNNKTVKDGTYYIIENGNVCLENYDETSKKCNDNDSNPNNNELVVQIKGEKPTSGIISIKDGKIENIELIISNKELWINPETDKIEIKEESSTPEIVLAPGLYDENDNLLASWDELVTNYDFENLVQNGGVDEENVIGYAAQVIEANYSEAIKLVIDKSITEVGYGAFAGCTNLVEIILPNSVISIGYSAFGGCTSLTSITIPSSVTSIGYSAFYGCNSLTSIIIEEGVQSIGNRAFGECTSLTNITIPNSVTSIGYSAFYGCNSLTNITIPNSVTSIGESAFKGCTGLKEITIPSSVTSIGGSAFYGCNSLTNITIPNSVTSIGGSAFKGCTGLKEITIPSSVTSIEDSAFSDCISLESITIPSSVINLGDAIEDNQGNIVRYVGAFTGCTNLKTIYYKGDAYGYEYNWGAPPTTTIIKDF